MCAWRVPAVRNTTTSTPGRDSLEIRGAEGPQGRAEVARDVCPNVCPDAVLVGLFSASTSSIRDERVRCVWRGVRVRADLTAECVGVTA